MTYNEAGIRQKIKELGPWRHNIDLGNGITTGTQPERLERLTGKWNLIKKYFPSDLSGHTVLDLGCNSGFFSVQCKLLGAKKVLAVDSVERSTKQAKFLSEVFQVELEIKQEDAHIFTLTTDEHFDFIIFSRTFYHLKYPNLVLDRLAEMVQKKLILINENIGSERIIEPKDDYKIIEKDLLLLPEYPKMFFIEKKFANDFTNWWYTNESCTCSLVRSSGMKVVDHPRKNIFICEPSRTRKKISLKGVDLFFPST